MATKSIPAWAKYVVMGYPEDDPDCWGEPINYFKDRKSAEVYAYNYQREHYGFIRTYVEKVERDYSRSPLAEIDNAFSEGKKMIRM